MLPARLQTAEIMQVLYDPKCEGNVYYYELKIQEQPDECQ